MSISQLFQPNGYNLHCNSLTTAVGGSQDINVVVNNATKEAGVKRYEKLTDIYPTVIYTDEKNPKIMVMVSTTMWVEGTGVAFIRVKCNGRIAWCSSGSISTPIHIQFIDCPCGDDNYIEGLEGRPYRFVYSLEIQTDVCSAYLTHTMVDNHANFHPTSTQISLMEFFTKGNIYDLNSKSEPVLYPKEKQEQVVTDEKKDEEEDKDYEKVNAPPQYE